MKRKILSLILCVLMCLSLMPMAAAEGSTAESTESAGTAQPTNSIEPTEPVEPAEPIEPIEPVEPTDPIEPSVPEEAQPEDDVSLAASETDKIILPAPTELTWGKLYSSDGVPYDIPDAMSCRISTPEVSHVEFELYDADTDMQINHPGSYTGFPDCSGYCSSSVQDLFEAFELDSGRYYFKARCTPHFEDEAQYLPSDWVRSEDWTYVKPSQRLNARTDLSLDNKILSFTLPANADMLLGMDVEFWYSPVEDGKYIMISSTFSPKEFLYHSGLKDGMKWDWDHVPGLEYSGYYKVRVRFTSRDITKYCGSGWSEYSNAIYQPRNDNSGECFSNLEELIALCSRDFTDYTIAYYQPAAGSNEAFSISSDLTIPELLDISFGNADVVIPKGATLTIDGVLSAYSHNGLSISGNIILNETGILNIYNAEVSASASITNNGIIDVTDTMSFDGSSCYSGNGFILVYDTYGNDSPFSQLPGLEPSSFCVDYQADFNNPYWLLQLEEASTTPGDVNGDGVVNVLDLVRLQKFLSGDDVSIVDADFNGDGVINVLDLLRLKKFLAGMDVTLN